MNAARVGEGRLGRWFVVLVLGFVIGMFALPDRATAAGRPQPPAPGIPRPRVEMPAPDAAPSAEVTFAAPQRAAIVKELTTNDRRVYVVGDPVSDPKVPGEGYRVEAVEAGGIQLRDARSQKLLRVAAGAMIPGLNGRRLVETTSLQGLEYRYVAARDRLDPEPRLITIRDGRAYVEVDTAVTTVANVSPPPAPSAVTPMEAQPLHLRQRLDATILEKVRLKETGRNSYEVGAAELREALDHGGRILAEAWSTVRPMVSLQDGITFRVQSAVADGTLGPRGFQVNSPNMAERAGIQMGDVIVAVNGQTIKGFGDLFRLYQQVRGDQRISTVTLDLERNGQALTKTFRIR